MRITLVKHGRKGAGSWKVVLVRVPAGDKGMSQTV